MENIIIIYMPLYKINPFTLTVPSPKLRNFSKLQTGWNWKTHSTIVKNWSTAFQWIVTLIMSIESKVGKLCPRNVTLGVKGLSHRFIMLTLISSFWSTKWLGIYLDRGSVRLSVKVKCFARTQCKFTAQSSRFQLHSILNTSTTMSFFTNFTL